MQILVHKGGEYISKTLKAWCDDWRIVHDFSAP